MLKGIIIFIIYFLSIQFIIQYVGIQYKTISCVKFIEIYYFFIFINLQITVNILSKLLYKNNTNRIAGRVQSKETSLLCEGNVSHGLRPKYNNHLVNWYYVS